MSMRVPTRIKAFGFALPVLWEEELFGISLSFGGSIMSETIFVRRIEYKHPMEGFAGTLNWREAGGKGFWSEYHFHPGEKERDKIETRVIPALKRLFKKILDAKMSPRNCVKLKLPSVQHNKQISVSEYINIPEELLAMCD